MKTTETEKNISREALLDAAESLFTSKGFSAVSTRELAELAQVNLGAIQYHFGSKAALFSETIRRLINRERGTRTIEHCQCHEVPATEQEAATLLATFVRRFLSFLLRPEGPAVCRMMFREILSETVEDTELSEVLVSTAVAEFMEPVDQILRVYIQKLRPELVLQEVELYTQSMIGQCCFYVTHAPLLRRLRGRDFAASPEFEKVSRHVAEFSLYGLGCSAAMVETALSAASPANVFKENNSLSLKQ